MTLPFPVLEEVLTVVVIVAAARTLYWKLFARHLKISYERAPVWTFFYFSAFALLIGLLFPSYIARLFAQVAPVGYIALTFLFVVVGPVVYHTLRKQGGVPRWFMLATPDEPILTLGERFILAKVADVIMQEFAAGIIILALSDAGLSYPWVVFASILVFGAAHAYIFVTSGAFWGIYYTSYAALGGFAIPFLILFVPAGIVYALVLHMLFYVLSGAFFAKFPNPDAHELSAPLGV